VPLRILRKPVDTAFPAEVFVSPEGPFPPSLGTEKRSSVLADDGSAPFFPDPKVLCSGT